MEDVVGSSPTGCTKYYGPDPDGREFGLQPIRLSSILTVSTTNCEYSTVVSAPAFQVGDESSILSTRTKYGLMVKMAIIVDLHSTVPGSSPGRSTLNFLVIYI